MGRRFIESYSPDQVGFVLASGSKRRREAAEALFAGIFGPAVLDYILLTQVPGGPEEEAAPVEQVARQKTIYAQKQVEAHSSEFPKIKEIIALGADVNNQVAGKLHGKLASLEDLAVNLLDLGREGRYFIVSATAVANGALVSHQSTSRVELNAKGRKLLANQKAVADFLPQYLEMVAKLYGSSQEVFKMSAGFDIISLINLGVVESVNGEPVQTSEGTRALMSAMNAALTSVDYPFLAHYFSVPASRYENYNPAVQQAMDQLM